MHSRHEMVPMQLNSDKLTQQYLLLTSFFVVAFLDGALLHVSLVPSYFVGERSREPSKK